MKDRVLIHDRALLDALEAIEPTLFNAPVWRVCREGRDPTQGYPGGGRWDPATFEALYTSLESEGAIREMLYHLSLQPVFPSKPKYYVHELAVALRRSLRFVDLAALEALGVPLDEYRSRDCKRARGTVYPHTQSIGAAACFLEFDGLVVPSARHDSLNLVIFTEKLDPADRPVVETSSVIDWARWRN